MILGGTYKIPVMEGLLSKNFVNDLKLAGTFNDQSFQREYESIWAGDAENAFFSSEVFDKRRELLQPENEYSGRSSKGAYYVIGVDVGRFKCTTEAIIFKVTPQPTGPSIKSVVNIFTYDAEHFEAQAIHLKKLFKRFKARKMAVDANGVGAGLVDFLVLSQVDPETGEVLPPFGVMNDEDKKYKNFRTVDTVADALYLIKANAPMNTEMYAYAQSQLLNGKIKFLIDENTAKVKLMSKKVGQEMTPDKRADYLRPFTLTTVLREQCLNLTYENEGLNIILKQSNKNILKDKFSAFIYGLHYIKQEEDRRLKQKKRSFKDFMFFN